MVDPLPIDEVLPEVQRLLSEPEPRYDYGEQTYRFRHLGMYLGGQSATLPEDDSFVPVVLVRAGDRPLR